jgi:hypothetical protein
MKKTIISIMMIVMFLIGYGVASYYDTHYTKDATITYINHMTEECIALDEQGYLWEFKANNLDCGQKVRLIMNNNHTIDNHDDIVENVKAKANV